MKGGDMAHDIGEASVTINGQEVPGVKAWAPDRAEDMTAAITQAVGAGSVCWESMEGTGVFQSEQALAVAKGVEEWIRGNYDVSPKLAPDEFSRAQLIAMAKDSHGGYVAASERTDAFRDGILRFLGYKEMDPIPSDVDILLKLEKRRVAEQTPTVVNIYNPSGEEVAGATRFPPRPVRDNPQA